MAKLPLLTGKEVAKVIEEFGFIYNHTTGSHMIYRHPDGRRTSIPHHSGEEIGPGLLTKIIKKDLGISREEFMKHIK
ncbi:type II toxin-antitoxin system HicA family toxin [Candidatus Woesearchaeota archaeon]|nr:type II toxin-antitoxin system HicA family toxin [Candidatus Woesearchaeota archaeon]